MPLCLTLTHPESRPRGCPRPSFPGLVLGPGGGSREGREDFPVRDFDRKEA